MGDEKVVQRVRKGTDRVSTESFGQLGQVSNFFFCCGPFFSRKKYREKLTDEFFSFGSYSNLWENSVGLSNSSRGSMSNPDSTFIFRNPGFPHFLFSLSLPFVSRLCLCLCVNCVLFCSAVLGSYILFFVTPSFLGNFRALLNPFLCNQILSIVFCPSNQFPLSGFRSEQGTVSSGSYR